jgi:sugar O-acyltransferase (sialic acid O-acetyltransferase NeuD family)
MENPVIILGAKGLGRVAADIFLNNDVVVYGLLDDDTTLHQQEIDNIMVLGSTDDDGFLKLIGKKCEAFVASDDLKIRKQTVEMLLQRRKIMPVNAIHKQAYIAKSAEIGHGNLIATGVSVGAGVKISSHCIILSNAVVEFGSKIADYVQIGAGAIIGNDVEIEEGAFIGAGVTIVAGVKIGKSARVGAGSVVIEDVVKSMTVFGNPAKKV